MLMKKSNLMIGVIILKKPSHVQRVFKYYPGKEFSRTTRLLGISMFYFHVIWLATGRILAKEYRMYWIRVPFYYKFYFDVRMTQFINRMTSPLSATLKKRMGKKIIKK